MRLGAVPASALQLQYYASIRNNAAAIQGGTCRVEIITEVLYQTAWEPVYSLYSGKLPIYLPVFKCFWRVDPSAYFLLNICLLQLIACTWGGGGEIKENKILLNLWAVIMLKNVNKCNLNSPYSPFINFHSYLLHSCPTNQQKHVVWGESSVSSKKHSGLAACPGLSTLTASLKLINHCCSGKKYCEFKVTCSVLCQQCLSLNIKTNKLPPVYCSLFKCKELFPSKDKVVVIATPNLSSVLQDRKKALEEMIGYYRFCSSCEAFQSWMKEKENIFRTLQPQADNVEVMQQKYQVSLFAACRWPLLNQTDLGRMDRHQKWSFESSSFVATYSVVHRSDIPLV